MKTILKFISIIAGISIGFIAIYYLTEILFKNHKKYFDPWDYDEYDF